MGGSPCLPEACSLCWALFDALPDHTMAAKVSSAAGRHAVCVESSETDPESDLGANLLSGARAISIGDRSHRTDRGSPWKVWR